MSEKHEQRVGDREELVEAVGAEHTPSLRELQPEDQCHEAARQKKTSPVPM